jgi:hypothetical protein
VAKAFEKSTAFAMFLHNRKYLDPVGGFKKHFEFRKLRRR